MRNFLSIGLFYLNIYILPNEIEVLRLNVKVKKYMKNSNTQFIIIIQYAEVWIPVGTVVFPSSFLSELVVVREFFTLK